MRVLYLMGRLPLPATSGDTQRNLALLRAARSLASQLDVIALPQPDPEQTASGREQLARWCDTVVVAGRPVGDHLGAPLARALTVAGRPYYHSVGNAPALRAAVHRQLAATPYDAIVLSQLYLASAVPPEHLPRTVYDSHNVYHSRLAEALDRTALPSVVRDRMVRKVREQEAALLARAAVTIACSDDDAAAFREMRPGTPVEVIANGVEVPARLSRNGSGGPPLFLASLDATPNIDGLAHLVDAILPLLPGTVRIDVAGSNPRPAVTGILARAGDRVRFLGQVPDARQVMDGAGMLLVPLLSGGGTRLKVLEAFAVGLPVVSTSKGVEGIPAEPGRHAMVADAPDAFAEAVGELHADPARGARLAAAARALVAERFDWAHLGARFRDVLAAVPSRAR